MEIDLDLIRQVTAVIAVVFLAAPTFGFIRVLPRSEPVVRYFSIFAIMILIVSIARPLHAAFFGPVTDGAAIVFNVTYVAASVFCLKSFHLMIPRRSEVPPGALSQEDYRWWNAHLYPPVTKSIARFLRRTICHRWKGNPNVPRSDDDDP